MPTISTIILNKKAGQTTSFFMFKDLIYQVKKERYHTEV